MIRGVVSITDWEWFRYLSSCQGLDEVNFWRPRDLDRPKIEPGTPFIFKLRKNRGDRIVGYGVYARHSVLPAWLAWDAFGVANGASTFEAMRVQLEHLRRDASALQSAGDYSIGCVMLSAPVFLPEERWIVPPDDWAPNIVQGKGYDLTRGEGKRIWEQLLAASPVEQASGAASSVQEPLPLMYGEPRLVAPRLGQGTFRVAVADAYQRACAVTGEHSLPVLEAAHIRAFSAHGPHEVSNGLLLRTDIHRLFDRGYVTVDPDELRFVVSPRLREDYANGRTYYALAGSPLVLPPDEVDRPLREHLEWHARECFRG